MTRACESDIDAWIRQCVEFGNASLIVTADGRIRIPSPLSSLAQKTEGGDILYYEETAAGDTIWGWNDDLYYRAQNSQEDWLIDDAQIFTIFYDESNLQPYGQSRLSASVRHQITWASRILAYTESVGFNQSHTQLIFTNINQDIMQAYADNDPEAVDKLQAIKTGVHDALMLGSNDDGSETKVSTVDPTDPSGLIKVFERIAATVASSRGIEPREFGNTAAVAPSAEAQDATQKPLVSEVKRFSKKIRRTVLAALVAIADAYGEETPELYWGNPAMPSENAMIDALGKYLAARPYAKYSKATAIRFGTTPEEIEEWEDMGWIQTGKGAAIDIANVEVIEDAEIEA